MRDAQQRVRDLLQAIERIEACRLDEARFRADEVLQDTGVQLMIVAKPHTRCRECAPTIDT